MRHKADATVLIEEVKRRPILWDRNYESFNNKRLHETYWDEIAANLDTTRHSAKAKWKNLCDTYRKILKKSIVESEYTIQWIYYDQISFIKEHVLSVRNRKRTSAHRTGSTDKEQTGGVHIKQETIVASDDDDDEEDEDDDEGVAAANSDDSNASDDYPLKPPATATPPVTAATSTKDDDAAPTKPEATTPHVQDAQTATAAAPAAAADNTKKRKLDDEHDKETPPLSDPDYQFLMSLLPHVKKVAPSRTLPLRMKIMEIVHEAAYAK